MSTGQGKLARLELKSKSWPHSRENCQGTPSAKRLIALTIFYASFVQILIFSLQMLAALTRAG
ncbi:MAG: hypothetical protein UV02_C0006G0007 [Candidatus Kuenenbacteria bacterium GW2011_GWA2_42_15]|uniref:Uncharacterized protein n=1 Tax=Candidatus Kuenenbacteria bacterium GW2011_GWA2_42_15 TaxID=1618677 RepID=A0A0G1BZI3_9BACT|nr:MAG: hypothetical protein UV02_C0006G0007 [Candidatus Kuenenbacteria bacterium GW2011_GWA2_42_15]